MIYEITQHRQDADMYEITCVPRYASVGGKPHVELVAVMNGAHLPDDLKSRLQDGETVRVAMKEAT